MLELLAEINTFVKNHVELISLIGIPLLTFFVTKVSNAASERRSVTDREIERKLAIELKLVEFRQEWINGLRFDLAEFMSAIGDPESDGAAAKGLAAMAKVHLRLNPKDPDFEAFVDRMLALSARMHTPKTTKGAVEEWGMASADFIDISQRILKREWDRLKDDLELARQ